MVRRKDLGSPVKVTILEMVLCRMKTPEKQIRTRMTRCTPVLEQVFEHNIYQEDVEENIQPVLERNLYKKSRREHPANLEHIHQEPSKPTST